MAHKILVVDDEIFNLEILTDYLELNDYTVVAVNNGHDAFERLRESPREFSAVLLDRMMPELNGIETLAHIKTLPDCRYLPIIMQTAAAAPQQIAEGLQAGAYYYLTKPFSEEMLISVVKTAISDYQTYRKLEQELQQQNDALRLLRTGRFRFQTLEDIQHLAGLAAKLAPEPDKAIIGLSELMVNAVEHGNLNIQAHEKIQFIRQGIWLDEIERRLINNPDKYATLEICRTPQKVSFKISDQGSGFAWENHLAADASKMLEHYGKGIMLARMVSFHQLHYNNPGNQVIAEINLSD